jgi:hypothetical protein
MINAIRAGILAGALLAVGGCQSPADGPVEPPSATSAQPPQGGMAPQAGTTPGSMAPGGMGNRSLSGK